MKLAVMKKSKSKDKSKNKGDKCCLECLEGKKCKGGSVSSKLFQFTANAYRKRKCDGKARMLKEGEYHLGCHNFTGPGTRIELPEVANAIPYNPIDECSKRHDLAYAEAVKDPRTRAAKIRLADEEAIKCYDQYKNESGYTAARNGINSKMKLENVLPIITRSFAPNYSGRGIGSLRDLKRIGSLSDLKNKQRICVSVLMYELGIDEKEAKKIYNKYF